jgi:hypothetical protein
MVTELRCNEPNCPPFETVIALWAMDAPARQYKIHKAIIEVNYQDIQQLVLVTDNE